MRTLIKNATIINEGLSFKGSLLIDDARISAVMPCSAPDYNDRMLTVTGTDSVIDAAGLLLLPGAIDDQVHFRQPGATHKADIASESAAAALGGVTSFMDMPNNNPPACTLEALEEKYTIAAGQSTANYSFYLGADNGNISEIRAVNPANVCGVKIFMGSSTGNMLVDSHKTLEAIFHDSPVLVATHCEEENIIKENLRRAQLQYGEDIPVSRHPFIRSREACIASTAKAIALAERFGTRLHVLHVTTKEEIDMLCKAHEYSPKITFEVCVHYLWFCDRDYGRYGTLIKCNPAIKEESDMLALRDAVRKGLPGAVATDHAPHLLSEKNAQYTKAPSGLPTVQHSLRMMLLLAKAGCFTIEQVVESMCHAPARTFGIVDRGFLREGYFADIVLVNPSAPEAQTIVNKGNIAYKCGWSPLEGTALDYTIEHTFINGVQVVRKGLLTGTRAGQRLLFSI